VTASPPKPAVVDGDPVAPAVAGEVAEADTAEVGVAEVGVVAAADVLGRTERAEAGACSLAGGERGRIRLVAIFAWSTLCGPGTTPGAALTSLRHNAAVLAAESFRVVAALRDAFNAAARWAGVSSAFAFLSAVARAKRPTAASATATGSPPDPLNALPATTDTDPTGTERNGFGFQFGESDQSWPFPAVPLPTLTVGPVDTCRLEPPPVAAVSAHDPTGVKLRPETTVAPTTIATIMARARRDARPRALKALANNRESRFRAG